MAKVEKMNGEKGSTEGMYTHAYSGIPPGQWEFRIGDSEETVQGLGAEDPNDYIGSTFRISVEVKLGQVAKKDLANGTEDRLSLKVVNSGPLHLIKRGHKDEPKKDAEPIDPNQTTIDDPELNADAGDWTGDSDTGPDKTENVTKMFSDGS